LFIDTHPGLNEETLLSITISDVLLLIMRPDRQDYQGTAIAVDIARQLDVPKMMLMTEVEGERRYRPRLAPKRNRSVPKNVWDKLGDR
jgi:MinD-like ATPase involved in chromosome partitioning or flagellar assembly